MGLFYIIVGGVLIGLLWLILSHKRYRRNLEKCLKNMPGPEPNPIFGNMLDFAGPTYKFLNKIDEYFDEYGSTFKIYVGPLSCVVAVAEEKFMEYILSSTQIIEKSEQYEYLSNWLSEGLLTSSGIKWKKRRRMLTPAFHFSILDNFVDVFQDVGNIFVKKLEEHEGQDDFDIYPLVSLCTLDIICEAAMGISVNAQTNGSSEYVRSVKKICSIITDRNFSPLDKRVFQFTLNAYREKMALKVLHTHTDDVINKRIEQLKISNNEEVNDLGLKKKWAFLDLLLKSTMDGKPLSKTDIREEVDTFMFEGHDTTSSGISFALYLLANHPHIQQKALDEQRDIFGNINNVRVTINELQEMKYLELIIKETLRLYPSVPFFARRVTESFVYDNSIYPKGIQLLLCPFNSHKNPKYYPNPNKFLPERFLDIDGTNPYRYTPFSAGPRNCIGQKFAMLEMKSTISNVLRNFELLPANRNEELKLAPELILVSKNGVKLRLKRRSYNKSHFK